MWTWGRMDSRGRRRKTGLCGGNLSDTSTSHRSGKRSGGGGRRRRRLLFCYVAMLEKDASCMHCRECVCWRHCVQVPSCTTHVPWSVVSCRPTAAVGRTSTLARKDPPDPTQWTNSLRHMKQLTQTKSRKIWQTGDSWQHWTNILTTNTSKLRNTQNIITSRSTSFCNISSSEHTTHRWTPTCIAPRNNTNQSVLLPRHYPFHCPLHDNIRTWLLQLNHDTQHATWIYDTIATKMV